MLTDFECTRFRDCLNRMKESGERLKATNPTDSAANSALDFYILAVDHALESLDLCQKGAALETLSIHLHQFDELLGGVKCKS